MITRLLLFAAALALSLTGLHAAPGAALVAPFSAVAMEFPESIAVDRFGHCYLSLTATGTIKKVTPAGLQSVFAKIEDDSIRGLAFDLSGHLLVAGGAGVWRVSPTGDVSLVARPGAGTLHDLALDPVGNIYASAQADAKSSAIWKIDPSGNIALWSDSPLLAPVKSFMPSPIGANGLAVDPLKWVLYVSVTSAGRIVEIKINPDGSAGAARTLVENEALIGADALRLDDRGNLYTAVSLTNRIVKISPDGHLCDLAVGGKLSFPTSLAIDERGGRCTLYVCNNGHAAFGATPRDPGLFKLTNPDPSRLIQVSTRGTVGPHGDVLVAGFVIEGPASKTLLVRAIGPALAAFGVVHPLADPKLAIFAAGEPAAPYYTNNNWSGDPALSGAAANCGAFPLADAESKDAALLVTLAPGSYTAQVSGADDAAGVALLEIYEIP